MTRRILLALPALSLLIMTTHTAAGPAPLQVEDLRCEYLTDPLGIDARQPRLSWTLSPGPRGRGQSACQVLVASSAAGLARDLGDRWDSGKVASDGSALVVYAGQPLASGARCFWKARVWDEKGQASPWSATAFWSMGLLEEGDWHGAWTGLPRPPGVAEGTPLPFPWLRKTFTLDRKPERAIATVNPLGYYELYVNGRKVDDHVLAPAVSDYSKRNLYVTHDVTEYLVAGKNCVALWLGRGWYVRGHPGVIHDGPLVRAQVEIQLPGGAAVRVGTDESWRVKESSLSPLGKGLAFGDYGGELHDGRQDLPEWNSVALDDSAWRAAARFDPPKVLTAAQMCEPNRLTETVPAVKVEPAGPGAWFIHMQKNLTGWFELRLPAELPAGTRVKLEYADAPPAGDRFPTHNQRDEVVVRGGADLRFRSRFNYHGFCVVRVTGLERAPALEDARGHLIHTGYAPAGEFACSDDLLNRIYGMMTWTYRNLSLGGYVVDCPTRERLGYGGDAGTSLETGMFNFDTAALYTRWLSNWRDAQHPATGDLPFTAPAYPNQGGGGPMWSGFVVTLPWQLYLQYGDRRALEANYPMIRKWLGYLQSETVDGLLERHECYMMRLPQWVFLGDWLAPRPLGERRRGSQFGDPLNVRFINNVHHLYQLQLAAKIARVLGLAGDAAEYETRATALARKLHERFYVPESGSYAGGQQPYLAFPLLVGMVPAEHRDAVMRNLEETIRVKDRGHINAGMHGTYFLLKYLMAADRNDLIHLIASQTEYPGWGYMLAQGATTSWEAWRPGMSSIHDTFIQPGAWFIQGIGGIRIDEESPGFRHFTIRPAPVGDLTFARATYRSIHGLIASDWRRENGVFSLQVTVPPRTTATVHVPTSDAAKVTEGGRPAAQAEGVRGMGVESGRAVFQVESGEYRFAAPLVP